MNCQKCNSERIIGINAKCSDLFSMTNQDGESKRGYVPTNLFFGSDGYGDYVEMDFCADCGQIQAKFPVTQSSIKKAMAELDD